MITKQTSKDKFWKDETGQEVPFGRITTIERMKESNAFALSITAQKIHDSIAAFKDNIRAVCQEVFDAVMTAKEKSKATKGGFTWYNFNSSLKIEVSINEQIEFDGLLIEKAKQKLDEMISEGINAEKSFIKSLVLSAFETSKGKLDTKKVLGLKKHTDRIKDKRFHEAMAFIDSSIRRPTSKTYFRVWVKNDQGQYESIDLNFSSING